MNDIHVSDVLLERIHRISPIGQICQNVLNACNTIFLLRIESTSLQCGGTVRRTYRFDSIPKRQNNTMVYLQNVIN